MHTDKAFKFFLGEAASQTNCVHPRSSVSQLFDEYHQMYVPGRYAGLLDVILNTIGAGVGIAVFGIKRVKRTEA